MISFEEVNELLDYNPETGMFLWKKKVSMAVNAGDIAGCLSPRGYVFIGIKRTTYRAHRLAWLLSHGEFPDGILDHINRIRNDNRLSNLRIVSYSENVKNMTMSSKNTSGSVGVHWYKRDGTWQANIGKDNKRLFLGSFIKKEDAISAYNKASLELFPEINGGL